MNDMQSAQPIIITDQVSIFYGEKRAIENANLKFYQNEIAALIGPSGCGKSTFLRSINRMNDFIATARTEGKVIVEEEDIYAASIDPVLVRRKVGMVFQKPNPFPKSIYDNVAWAPRKTGLPKSELNEIVENSLKKAALWEEVRDRLHQSALGLSGGQQQRLCIARAIAMQPKVLLMDEPCSALDPIATGRIEDLMRELQKDYTIVIVTHNMQQAARVSDKTVFFLNGKIIETGETREFFTRPKQVETENYITGKFG